MKITTALIALSCAASACAPIQSQMDASQPATNPETVVAGEPATEVADTGSVPNPTRDAFFGDLHVHTRYSFDAFAFGTVAGPDEAYAYAKGAPLKHPAGFEMKLDRPLDFEGVTDHGMYLGMLRGMTDPDSPAYNHPMAEEMRSAKTVEDRQHVFTGMFPYLRGEKDKQKYLDKGVVRNAWSDIIDAANRNNDPGKFTAFVAYEYTSAGGARDNLHRNVIFRGDSGPTLPFTRMDSPNPEDLWAKMEEWRDEGMEVLSIPHNSNGSGGRMFQYTYYDGKPIDDAYSKTRMRNEPLAEITQVKGTSETHPALSPNDEWAGFEIMPYKIASTELSDPNGSYVRQAYRRGLELDAQGNGNPYKFGVIGSTDTHVAAGPFSEDDYWSKAGMLDATPELRGSVPTKEVAATGEEGVEDNVLGANALVDDGTGRKYRSTYFDTWGASGLAGIWAEENTREALFDAMRRKETFATSGPRIRVRFFGGPSFQAEDLNRPDFLTYAYSSGVPMGGDLYNEGNTSPSFVVWATRDPMEAPLQRVQVIKAWTTADGESQEKVFDAACSDGLSVDATTYRCPDNGASVDIDTCEISDDAGADELKSVWTDPEFSPDQAAVYYVRVLQNPTCRWSTWDALREGVQPRQDIPSTIQERAWSSPIWYTPTSG